MSALPSDNVRTGVLVVRLIWQGVRHARGRAVALAAGMLVAAVAFSLLTASVVVNAATIRGDVSANWRGAYDLLWRAVLVLPVAVVLALLAGAVRAGRAGLAVGVAGLTVLLAARDSFTTSIGDSALAGLISASTSGAELVAVLLTIELSAIGLGDITYLNARERSSELAALAASGWGRASLGRLLATEAFVTAAAGAVVGAAAGLALAADGFGLSGLVITAAAAAGGGGLLVTLAVTVAVLAITLRRPLAAVLAADE